MERGKSQGREGGRRGGREGSGVQGCVRGERTSYCITKSSVSVPTGLKERVVTLFSTYSRIVLCLPAVCMGVWWPLVCVAWGCFLVCLSLLFFLFFISFGSCIVRVLSPLCLYGRVLTSSVLPEVGFWSVFLFSYFSSFFLSFCSCIIRVLFLYCPRRVYGLCWPLSVSWCWFWVCLSLLY